MQDCCRYIKFAKIKNQPCLIHLFSSFFLTKQLSLSINERKKGHTKKTPPLKEETPTIQNRSYKTKYKKSSKSNPKMEHDI